MDLASAAAQRLARRSSRRQFFKFLGAGSLGAGLWLTRTDVSSVPSPCPPPSAPIAARVSS
jgi:hypothetical protein